MAKANITKADAIKALAACEFEHTNWATEDSAAAVANAKALVASFDDVEEVKPESASKRTPVANVKYFGFFCVNTNGRVSVQVCAGSAREGYATDKTARAKANSRVEAYNAKRPGTAWNPIVCAFETNAAMYAYLEEANNMVQGRP